MSVIKVTSKIKNLINDEEEVYVGNALFHSDKINYNDSLASYEIRILPKKIVLKKTRKDGVSLIFCFIENEKTDVLLKENEMHLSIPLYTSSINLEDGKIEISYLLNDTEKFSFQFQYEM